MHLRIMSLLLFALPITACDTAQSQSNFTGTELNQSNADGGARCEGDHGGRHGHHRPPPEAFKACEGHAVDSACSVVIHDETLAGTCKAPRNSENGALACRPNPPAELIQACAGLAEGATCTFTSRRDGEAVEGTCKKKHDGADLICLPAHGPWGHRRQHND